MFSLTLTHFNNVGKHTELFFSSSLLKPGTLHTEQGHCSPTVTFTCNAFTLTHSHCWHTFTLAPSHCGVALYLFLSVQAKDKIKKACCANTATDGCELANFGDYDANVADVGQR